LRLRLGAGKRILQLICGGLLLVPRLMMKVAKTFGRQFEYECSLVTNAEQDDNDLEGRRIQWCQYATNIIVGEIWR
jgi:hypothetical protein